MIKHGLDIISIDKENVSTFTQSCKNKKQANFARNFGCSECEKGK